MQYDFPALFYSDENAVAFHFYDREDWFSFGDNVDEAIAAAEEILSDSLLTLEREGKEIPTPTPLDKVEVKPLQLVKMIHADTDQYARELDAMNNREAIEQADNPIKELRTRHGLSIKELGCVGKIEQTKKHKQFSDKISLKVEECLCQTYFIT